MNASDIRGDTIVARALETGPAVRGLFVSRRTACVGCSMDRFCTVRDAAEAYNLDTEKFIADLLSLARIRQPTTGGTRE